MKVILSESTPPQKGDKFTHNGMVVTALDSVGVYIGAIPAYSVFDCFYGLEVEREDQPIVIVVSTNPSGYYIDGSNLGLPGVLQDQPDGTRLVLILESEYKRLRGEG